MTEETVKTKRLVLKAISGEDGEALAALLLNDEVKKTYMIPDLADQQALDRMVAALVRLSCDRDHFTRGIYLDRYLIGFVNDVEITDSCVELGYVIHPAFWGRGYATEMLGGVISHLLGKRFSAVKAGAFCENAASIRVMEKCGMEKCPETEQIEYRGTMHRCVYYAISV